MTHKSSNTQTALQKSKQPGNAIGPCICQLVFSQRPESKPLTACLVDKVAEDKVPRVVVAGGAGEDRNANDGKSGQRPGEGCLVEVRQNAVSESIDEESTDVVGDINQKLVPALGVVALMETLEAEPSQHWNMAHTGFIREIQPRTSWLPSKPPVATRATQPEQFTQPVIQDRMGIHFSQETRRG